MHFNRRRCFVAVAHSSGVAPGQSGGERELGASQLACARSAEREHKVEENSDESLGEDDGSRASGQKVEAARNRPGQKTLSRAVQPVDRSIRAIEPS